MITKTRSKYFAVSVGVLLAALLLATPVFADGETPVEEPPAQAEPTAEEPAVPPGNTDATEEETPPPAEDAALTEEATPPAGEDEAEMPEATTNADLPAEDAGEETESIPQALAEADLELSDETGEAVDMASTESAEALKAPDPYYKVGKTYYRFFESATGCDAYPGEEAAGTCFDGEANPIQAAIDNVSTSGLLPTDRKIYVETGTYNGGAAFDATTTPILAQLNGLIGVYDSTTETRPIINGDVVLDQNVGGFTLSGFTINGYFGTYDSAGTLVLDDLEVTNTGGDGIYISHHDGNVQIKNTNSSGNNQGGAYVDNGDPGNNYSVTINNAHFDENGLPFGNVNSLEIITLGKVTLENVSASRNRGTGIRLDTDFSSLTIKNAVMASNAPNPSGAGYGYALYANSSKKANITLDMVMAGGNSENTDTMYLATAGSVTGSDIVSQHNAGTGMYILNTAGTGSVKISESKFMDNASGSGLFIQSDGSVSLSSIDASNNGNHGVYIDTSNSVTVTSLKSLGLFGANDFGGNGGTGLSVMASKAIAVSNLTANNNGVIGVWLNNLTGTSGVTIKKTLPTSQYYTFYNTAHDNGDDGLRIASNGAIRMEYLMADSNQDDGFEISNSTSTKSPAIQVLYSESHENGSYGMNFESKGSIALTNVSANLNGQTLSRDGVRFSTSGGTSGGVTITGKSGYVCAFNNNSRYGIHMDVLGNVSIKNAEANGNANSTYIANHTAASNRTVKLVNFNATSITGGAGLEVFSKGNITLDTVNASWNNNGGAYLNNGYGTGSVSIKNGDFIGNSGDNGLEVYSNKNITLYAIQAFGNSGHGLYLDNCRFSGSECTGSGSISIKSGKNSYNSFTQNDDSGAYMTSKGNITLSNIIAVENGTHGMSIYNSPDTVSGNVTISTGSNMRNYFGDNGGMGLNLTTLGNISVKNTDVMGNQLSGGVYLQNNGALKAKSVKVQDSTFIKNNGTGLQILSLGTVTLQGVDASDNSVFEGTFNISGDGITDVLSSSFEHDTFTFTAASAGDGYTINLESAFFDAYLELRGPDGALIDSDDDSGGGTKATMTGTVPSAGDYTIHVLSANEYGSGRYALQLNGGSYNQFNFRGVDINNATGNGSVKVLYSSKMGIGLRADYNSFDGVRVESTGSVSISRADIYNNGYRGLWIDNQSDAEQPISLNTVFVAESPNNGISLYSKGNISLSKVTTYNNKGVGATLQNYQAAKDRTVKVSSSNIFLNSGTEGLQILSKGNVTLTNVESQNFGGSTNGVSINNTYGTGNVSVGGKTNILDNNGGTGLFIQSHGDISLTNVMASSNGGRGIYARNAYSGYDAKNVKITATGGKTMNTLHNNGEDSLYVITFGTISVNKVEAVGNNHYAYLQNSGAPDLKKVNVTNSVFNGTAGQGLSISAYGPVSLSNIWALGNFSTGLVIDNQSAAGQDVSIKSTTSSNNFDTGARIISSGLVKLDRSAFSDNHGAGFYADNSTGTEGILVQNSTAALNWSNGFDLFSNGTLTIKNTTSITNSAMGIFFDGLNSGAKVTLSNLFTTLNVGNGIHLLDVADVSISGTTSAVNGDPTHNSDGLYINSNGTGVVTISKSTFISNFASGVELVDVGTFTPTSTVIFGNDLDGSGDEDLYEH